MQTIWKGAINFGLVNVPVKMYTATANNDIAMKMLHKEYNVPIKYARTCSKCKEDVEWADIVKGYEYESGHYVTFDDKEMEELASESSREIQILDFVNLEEIDPIYYQKTYYLAPEKTGKHAYTLLVEALTATNKIGIANVTIRSKSSLAAIRVSDGILSMVTMYYAEEIREKEGVPNLPKQTKINERELDMAKLLIEQLSTKFEPEKYKDEYRQRILDAIEDKIEGKDVRTAPEEKKTNVIDLMEALKASLKQSNAGGSKTGSSVADSDQEAGKTTKPRAKRTTTAKKPAASKKTTASKRTAESKKTTASKSEAKPSKRRTGA